MKQQTHKEYMEEIKEFDPILYSELTSNPTGSDGDNDGCLGLVIVLGILAVIFTLIFFFGGQSPK